MTIRPERLLRIVVAVLASAAGTGLLPLGAEPTVIPAAWTDDPPSPRELVRMLTTDQADAALCRLMSLRLRARNAPSSEAHDSCPVHYAVHDRADGRTYTAVFRGADYCRRCAPGKPYGHLLIFDGDGYQQAIYHNANVVDDRGGLIRFKPDRTAVIIEIHHSFRHEGRKLTQSALAVVPIASADQPILVLFLGRPGPRWLSSNWWVQDRSDGAQILHIGHDSKSTSTAVASYAWSEEDQALVGPQGSPAAGFLVIEPDSGREAYAQAAKAYMREAVRHETDPALRDR